MNFAKALTETYRHSLKSPDLSTQNGAAIYRGDILLATHYNTPLVALEPHMEQAPDKYWYYEHAERNVLFRLASSGINTSNTTMVCQFAACADCARAIIACGVRRVIVHGPIMDAAPARWMPSIEAGNWQLKKAGVAVQRFEGLLNLDFQIRFDGQLRSF